MNKKAVIVILCLLTAITLIAFYPCINNGFTNWDDDKQLTENPKITQLTWKNTGNYFIEAHDGLYHPLVLLSFAIEYHFFKFNPTPYHVTNLIFHLFNVLLVFWLFLMISKKTWSALIVALLFAIHPLHVASVAWIAERKDVMYAFFFLGSLISYLYYKRDNKTNYYLLTIFLFILSLLAKPMGITLPVVLLLIDYFMDNKFSKKIILNKIPFFLLTLAFIIIAFYARYTRILFIQPTLNTFDNLFVANFGLLFYLIKTVFPLNLSCYYPTPLKVGGLLPTTFLISPLFVILLAVLIFLTRKKTKIMIFGALFYLVTISPVLHLVSGGPIVANHYTYIPLLGIFFIIGEGFTRYYDNASKRSNSLRILLLITVIFALSSLAFISWQRCQVYKNSVTLWEDFFRKFGDHPNIAIPYNNRGSAYQKEGKFLEALSDYTNAMRVDPGYSVAYNNRGSLYTTMGKNNEALADLTRAVELTSDLAEAYYNRGNVHMKMRNLDQAVLDYKKALSIKPTYIEAINNMANIFGETGRKKEAIECYTRAITINPSFAIAYYNRGNEFARLGDPKKGD
ncbi:tetratricopeptide repeat protein [Candidatus Auribacterota bacterium]